MERNLASIGGDFNQYPRAYQIVIKATANTWLPLSFQYETHRVLQP